MRRNLLKWAVVQSLLLLFAAAAFGKPDARRDLPPSQRKLIIREAYANLARLAAAGGHQIRFEISNVRTIGAPAFDATFWVDLMNMPGGAMIDVLREATSFDGRGEMVVYRPKWNLEGGEYLLTEEGTRLQTMTVDKVLAEIGGEIPDARDVQAITSYSVKVHFEERSRAYKAAVLWLPAGPRRDATVYFMDHITQGLEEALRERPKPAPILPFADTSPQKTLYCAANSYEQGLYRVASDSTNHFTGRHGATLSVKFKCSCDSSCQSTCRPTKQFSDCYDTGVIADGLCHKMATSYNEVVRYKGAATSSGAECGAGLGCVKKTCMFCTCGLGVSVPISGATVSFTTTGSPDWQGNFAAEMACAPCEEVPPPPPPGGGGGQDPNPGGVLEPDPNPNPGSGGGAPAGCWWYCVPRWSGGIYHEDCTLRC